MKRSKKKKIKALFLVASFAACGCGVNVVEAGLKGTVETVVAGFSIGVLTAYVAPKIIENKIYSELDKAIDDRNLPKEMSEGIKKEVKRQIEEKLNKEGLIKTVRSLLRIVDGIKKVENQDTIDKLKSIYDVLNREKIDISAILFAAASGLVNDGVNAVGGLVNYGVNAVGNLINEDSGKFWEGL